MGNFKSLYFRTMQIQAFTFFDAKKSNKKRHKRQKYHFSFHTNPHTLKVYILQYGSNLLKKETQGWF